MEFSKNVVLLERGDKKFYLIGTAHVSQKSVEEVNHVIETLRPDSVCVELCQTRYQALTDENHWKKLNIVEVIKQGKALMLLASLALSSFQRKMGAQLGVEPGAELMAGVHKAKEVGAKLVLADRDVRITLKRAWANLSFWRKMVVFSGLLDSLFTKEEVTAEQLEEMKDRDQVSELMDEFAKAMPKVKEPLIDERDRYLMSKIEEAEGDTVVAVVGAGHLRGMIENFGKPVDRAALEQLPKPSKWIGVLKWLVPAIVLALFGVGIYKHQGQAWQEMIFAWVLPNALLAGLFTLFGGARLLTVLATMVAAPITSLNPSLGAGMIAGLVEGWLRKPTVADCERIPEDIKSLRGFMRNNFTRVLLIFMLANFGSMLGTYVGIYWLATL